MANQNIKDVVTGKARLSYTHLFTPHASQQGAEPKYSTTILVPKTDIGTKQRIDAAINAAIADGVSSKWNGVRPPVLAIPVYDGDGVRPSDGMPFGEECKGHWVFTASSKQAPEIVDLSMQRILNQADIYSGIYARVSVSFFPYASNGKKGIGCGLGPIQKLEDGELLGGRVSAAAAFGDNLTWQNARSAQGSVYIQQPTTYPQQPVYNSQPTVYTPQPPVTPGYQHPVYAQTMESGYQTKVYNQALQPVYQQPAYIKPVQTAAEHQPLQIDPITGAPISGGVMGI
jgi:hypothetical protein